MSKNGTEGINKVYNIGEYNNRYIYIYLTCVGRDPSLVQPLEQQAHAVCRVPNLRLVQVVVFAVLPDQANLPCKVSVSAIAIVSLRGREGGTRGQEGQEGQEGQ